MSFELFSISHKQLIRISFITLGLLLIPLVAMQFTDEVSWQAGDFIVAGSLLLIFGYCYELLHKWLPGKRRHVLITVTMLLLFLLVWSILAVDLI